MLAVLSVKTQVGPFHPHKKPAQLSVPVTLDRRIPGGSLIAIIAASVSSRSTEDPV